MTVHTVHRLRIRPGSGPGAAARATLLARVAHDGLGAALDGALAGVVPESEAVEVPRLHVRLELDPAGVDEESLALLWADRVRRALADRLRERPARPPDPATGFLADDPAGEPAAADVRRLSALLEEWVTASTSATESVSSLPAALRRLGRDPALRATVVAGLPRPLRTRAAQLLAPGGVPVPEPGPVDAGPRPDGPTAAAAGDPGDVARTTAAEAPGTTRAPAPDPSPAPAIEKDPRPPVAELDDPTRRVEPPGNPGIVVSECGGLVLLHHRLRRHLENAVERDPEHDPVSVRAAALAVLADAPATDPLVRLLAGDPEWDLPPVPVVTPHRVPPEPAEKVLAGFAADLPGFGRSSPGFVREQWILRRGVLLPDPPEVLVRLQRRPLDLVLDRLPYPVGALRLPWTPTLLVGWEAR